MSNDDIFVSFPTEEELKEAKKEAKRREKRERRKERLEQIKNFALNNKELCAAVALSAIGGGCKITSEAIRHHKAKKLEHLKEEYIYDRSLGSYYKCNRRLKNSELLEIEARKKNGETLGEILTSMRLL